MARSAVEIARLCHTDVVAMEKSYLMLVAFQHLFEHRRDEKEKIIFPFAFGFSNRHDRSKQFQAIKIEFGSISACSANTLVMENRAFDKSNRKSTFDVIVTEFFLDTVDDIVSALMSILESLKNNGIWIFWGPLNWHCEDAFKLSLVELIDLAESLGATLLYRKDFAAMPYVDEGEMK
eukprot:UC4_evm1s1186